MKPKALILEYWQRFIGVVLFRPSPKSCIMADPGSRAPHGSEFRQYLPDLSIPRFTTMQKQDPYEYTKDFKENGAPPWLHALYLHWQKLLAEPFKGVTNDGK